MSKEETRSCKACGCDENVVDDHHYCRACHDDLVRINEDKHLSAEVKLYITNNYSKYLQWLITQEAKFEWNAEYHTFQETCEDFYLSDTCDCVECTEES